MNLNPEDYGVLTRMLIEGTGMPPLALTLEGGYGPSHGKRSRRYLLLCGAGSLPSQTNRPPRTGARRRVVEILKKSSSVEGRISSPPKFAFA